MTNVFTWLALVAILWILREIIVSLWNWRRIQKLNSVIRVERTRGQFAKARNSLMHLALRDEIDPNSATFKKLYYIDTMFMRLPTRYPELSAGLRRSLFNNNREPNQELLAEKDNWSEGTRTVIRETSEAIDNVLTEYSLLFWVLSHIAKRPWLANPIASFLRKTARLLEAAIEKRNPDISDIRRAQVVMDQMAAA